MDILEGGKDFGKTNQVRRKHFAVADEWWNNRREIEDDSETWKNRKYSAEELIASNYSLDLCGFPVKDKEVLRPEEMMRKAVCQWDDLKHREVMRTGDGL